MIFSNHLLYYTYILSFLYSWNWWRDCQLQMMSRQFFKYINWSLPKRTSATTYASAIGSATIFKTVTFSSRRLSQKKWNESGFRPPLCTYRLNWARITFWGWWDKWDDTVLQTQDSKFEPWRSEAEHATSRSQRLPTILSFTRGWGGGEHLCFFQTAETGNRTPNSSVKGSGANHYLRAPARRLSRLTCRVR